MNSNYAVKCPGFDEALSSNGAALIPLSSKRDYGHPIDSSIIKQLDSPVINAVLKPAIDMIADYTAGQVIAQSIPVDANSFPEIDRIVNDCVMTLGIRKPYVVIDNGTGFNAYTTGSDEEPYIVLGSLLVDKMNTQQLKFIIGHECGHIAMGHVMYHVLASSAGELTGSIPIVGGILRSSVRSLLNAWVRRSEITADRAGLLCCRDPEVAKRSLIQLEAGFINADKLSIDSYVKNSRKFRKQSVLRRMGESSSDHPMLPKRIEALDLFAKSKKYYKSLGVSAPLTAISDNQLEAEVNKLLKVM